jgi:Spy/CpxP family protein refolding chaperone
MQSRIDHMEKSLAGMKEIQKARTALYQVLTTEQKAVLDQHAAHGRHG